MSNVKMSDVFELPVVPVDYQNGIRDGKGNIIMSGDEHENEKVAMCNAINQHDALTAKVAEQAAEIERLMKKIDDLDELRFKMAKLLSEKYGEMWASSYAVVLPKSKYKNIIK